jgi:peptidoglycan/xylan/chitin deacetylase (PgdA/CDA1 family)
MRAMPRSVRENGEAPATGARKLLSQLAIRVPRLIERRSRRSTRPVGLVLAYHEIAAAQGNREREIVPALGAELFRAQLEYLRRHYEVVPLQELLARIRDRAPGERIPVALTFDDDLSGHASVAAPILEEFGFPATFFLSGNCLQSASSFWWQDLQAILNRGPEEWPAVRETLAEDWPWARLDGGIYELAKTIEVLAPDQRDALSARLRELAGPEPPDDGLSTDAARGLVQRGFEVGFHTLRHYSLQTLDGADLDRAMSEGLDELEEVAGYRPTAIAYPHARADLRVAEAAQRAGFQLGVIMRGGAARLDQNPLLLDRVDAWTNSIGGFAWNLGRAA